MRDGKKLQHNGIKVEFVGSIGVFSASRHFSILLAHFLLPLASSDLLTFLSFAELFYDRGHHHEFLSLSQELAAPGEMRAAQTFDFNFKNVEKQYESYQGINVKLRCVAYPPAAGAE